MRKCENYVDTNESHDDFYKMLVMDVSGKMIQDQ